jgi:predicted lipoprotein
VKKVRPNCFPRVLKFKKDMSQTIFERLQLKNEKNLLIQGLPSSIEKQFSKLSFAKNLTPLLKSRKIDFALVFAVSENQLNGILNEVMPALKEDSKLWVAFPKLTSKIVTDLNRESSWNKLFAAGYENMEQVSLDHVWNAAQFRRNEVEVDAELEEMDVEVQVVSKTKRARLQ